MKRAGISGHLRWDGTAVRLGYGREAAAVGLRRLHLIEIVLVHIEPPFALQMFVDGAEDSLVGFSSEKAVSLFPWLGFYMFSVNHK